MTSEWRARYDLPGVWIPFADDEKVITIIHESFEPREPAAVRDLIDGLQQLSSAAGPEGRVLISVDEDSPTYASVMIADRPDAQAAGTPANLWAAAHELERATPDADVAVGESGDVGILRLVRQVSQVEGGLLTVTYLVARQSGGDVLRLRFVTSARTSDAAVEIFDEIATLTRWEQQHQTRVAGPPRGAVSPV